MLSIKVTLLKLQGALPQLPAIKGMRRGARDNVDVEKIWVDTLVEALVGSFKSLSTSLAPRIVSLVSLVMEDSLFPPCSFHCIHRLLQLF